MEDSSSSTDLGEENRCRGKEIHLMAVRAGSARRIATAVSNMDSGLPPAHRRNAVTSARAGAAIAVVSSTATWARITADRATSRSGGPLGGVGRDSPFPEANYA
jgi:hypothetical protein